MNVTSNNVNDVTKEIGVFEPAGSWLSGRNWSSVSSTCKSRLGRRDEASEAAWGSETLHESLVTDDHQDDEIPLTPSDNLRNLLLGNTRNSITLDKDTHDDLDVELLACGSDIGKSIAVRAVETDNIESGLGDKLDILHDTGGILAVTVLHVWSVGDT